MITRRSNSRYPAGRSRTTARLAAVLALSVVGLSVCTLGAGTASADEPTVGLGTAGQFAVLAGSDVTNTGPSVLVGADLGVSPGSAVTGFPPGVIDAPGAQHVTDAVAAQAQSDTTTAFNDAAGRTPTAGHSGITDLTGMTLQPGVFQGNALSLSGTVTLDNNDVPDAVFIFQASSTLITSSSSVVAFTNADHPSCNVFWEVGTSATLGTGSTFVGTLLAQASISAGTGANVQGRLLARNAAVTLDDNTITRLPCAAPTPTTSSSSSPTSTPTSTPAPVTSRSVIAPPVSTTPPPRDVTSGRTVPVTLQSPVVTTSSAKAGQGTSVTARSSTQNGAGSQTSTPSSDTSTLSSDTSLAVAGENESAGTNLANTGPAPVLPMTLAALVLLAAGWVMLSYGRSQRRRIGQHRA